MKIVITTISSDGTVHRYLPVSMEDWDEALTRAYSYILTDQVCQNDSTIRIKSIERTDVPGPCCECGEVEPEMTCNECGRPICYDCAKNSKNNEPICSECKKEEIII